MANRETRGRKPLPNDELLIRKDFYLRSDQLANIGIITEKFPAFDRRTSFARTIRILLDRGMESLIAEGIIYEEELISRERAELHF